MSNVTTKNVSRKNFRGSLDGTRYTIEQEGTNYVAHIAVPTEEQLKVLKNIPLKRVESASLNSLGEEIKKIQKNTKKNEPKTPAPASVSSTLAPQNGLIAPIPKRTNTTGLNALAAQSSKAPQGGISLSATSSTGSFQQVNPQETNTSSAIKKINNTPTIMGINMGQSSVEPLSLTGNQTNKKVTAIIGPPVPPRSTSEIPKTNETLGRASKTLEELISGPQTRTASESSTIPTAPNPSRTTSLLPTVVEQRRNRGNITTTVPSSVSSISPTAANSTKANIITNKGGKHKSRKSRKQRKSKKSRKQRKTRKH